jgi:hypothetical protein
VEAAGLAGDRRLKDFFFEKRSKKLLLVATGMRLKTAMSVT